MDARFIRRNIEANEIKKQIKIIRKKERVLKSDRESLNEKLILMVKGYLNIKKTLILRKRKPMLKSKKRPFYS